MKVTVSSEDTNKITVTEYNTRYNIGDVVLVNINPYSKCALPEKSTFCTDETDSNGCSITEKHVLPYIITDIEMSLASGKVIYKLRYSWRRCIFRSGCRSAREDEIRCKLTKEELDELLPKID